ncbi:myeloid leukemia factor 1 isoform X2 [Lissotriton helveticus]
MFGRHLHEFEEDPFFSDHFCSHREHVHRMMRSFSAPFGLDPFRSIAGAGERSDRRVAKRDNPTAIDSTDPFQAMDNVMANMRKQMFDVPRKIDCLPVGPTGHSFSSSSVMTFSKVGNEPPKVFQASSATRQAPGGIKETIKGVKDSESGIEKMAIGHHIKDRAHVIKKARNIRTGNEEQYQDFVNLDESEGPSFDEEWKSRAMSFKPSRGRHHLTGNPNCDQCHAIKNN